MDIFNQLNLPIKDVLPELTEKLNLINTLILSAPPGAGKSTLVPLALLGQSWLHDKKIIMLEPRRLAAKSVAIRMAMLLNEQVGETVGYRIRFETKISSKTKIEVVTEGILTRMLQQDNSLENIGCIIFDEFHERSIFADVSLAFSRETQNILRPDLRILIMSATLNLESLQQLLNAPVVKSDGKQYPVEIIYTDQQDERLMAEVCAQNAVKAIQKHEGDILIFLPGEGEIRKCEAILSQQNLNVELHPLYGNLPGNKQMAAILPSKFGKRKIVIATSIAETSLTIEGIKIVIDSGFGRKQKFDAKSGLSKLETIQISKDSADQRAGRAGRLSTGTCYRIWSKPAHFKLADFQTPEILEADLSSLMIDLYCWGTNDINSLTWLDSPPKHHVQMANKLLEELNAIQNNKITEHGKKMQALPCHPRIAHMMLMAQNSDSAVDFSLALASDIAAIIEERDPLDKTYGVDINLRIEQLRKQRKLKSLGKKFSRIAKIAEQYRQLFNVSENNDEFDSFLTGVLLVYAYPERIAFARPGNNAQFQLSGGNIAMMSHHDDLAHEPWLAVANLDARDGMGKIFSASPLNPKDLIPLLKERNNIGWNTKKGGFIATKELRIGSIVLKSEPIHDVSEKDKLNAILNALQKEGENLLNWDENVTQLQYRVDSLKQWNSDMTLPDLSTKKLVETCEDWISPYLTKIKTNEDLKALNLYEILYYSLSLNVQEKLSKLTPTTVKVPSESAIKINYQPNGNSPILAVRIQEVFGLADTPTVNQGKNKVLMHLLSPGYKPVQITGDLKSFWQNAYFEVKKELKQRYPKHAWPDDPWNHPAIKGTKKQNGL